MKKSELTPRAMARYDKILDAACEVFLEQGFEKASVNEIVKRAGGSLATLYKLFGNKENLFEAILERKSEAIFAELEEEAKASEEQDLESFLWRFGMKFFDMLAKCDSVAMVRILMAEGSRNEGKLGKIFYRHGPGKSEAILERFLRKEHIKGKIAIEDIALAAARFIFLVKEPFHFRSIALGHPMNLSLEERQRVVGEAIHIFLYGITKRSN
ncbi:TetR/AcrR family transcriptional regulator [Wolinella succinogenes]|uniref:Transcription Regulator Protein n=1 Tax=Wolinella succinogenes (strain ATCC 29543 / DSM 1740 / CCUG 13145 / JCM 31913 / LMG 7466 / NCTC 11488 / FDC 602W) TaxID=273121 RepID=Q7M9Q1_WOLSU|nr:TetR/AcrR family transcriptional regulator [Wolinella succinogenes]NLU33873.1 TetR/AcrR family transcriptional regulator [Wolinella succinogenes]CAE09883.1 Transcription Regulator Protein [Wolinella succinogenes]VEG82097.1 Uncharacterized HTH-type transcriptional regulator yvdT [Wolinella succinogenes]HCZ18055.1 TetR/AcrR family transcriptional regulator [Helicobacter sp.]